jgi:hypothetical protein
VPWADAALPSGTPFRAAVLELFLRDPAPATIVAASNRETFMGSTSSIVVRLL